MDEAAAGADDESSSSSLKCKPHQTNFSQSSPGKRAQDKSEKEHYQALPSIIVPPLVAQDHIVHVTVPYNKEESKHKYSYSDSELLDHEQRDTETSLGKMEEEEYDDRSLLSLPSNIDENEIMDEWMTPPQRSMSVDAAHFAAERAEENAGIVKSRLRVKRFRIGLSKRMAVLNPRSHAGVNRNTVTIQSCQSIHSNHVTPDDDIEGSSSSSSTFSLWGISRQDKLMLLALFLVDLSVYMSLSVMAPFFPQEAASNGLSSTMSGWVFGVFALVQFVMSPIFGKLIPYIGPRFLFLSGQFFAGGCSVLFGLLTFVPATPSSNGTYITLCFVLRIGLAVGCTASSTASFAVTANEFSDGATQVFGLLEMGAGLGLMAGPALGGVLYEFGGFAAPFAVLGGFLLLTIPLNAYLLPSYSVSVDEDTVNSHVGMLDMLSIPAVMVTCAATFMGSVSWSIMDPTLAPHFEVFGLTPSLLGLVFLLMSTFYAISSPVWGWVCDKVADSSPLLCAGFIFCTIGFLLLGPSPLLGFPHDYNSLWLNLVSLSLLGVSTSLAVIPTYDKLLDAAEKAGLDEGLEMYSIIAGLWSSVYALGDFAGPTLGGFLLDNVGFPWTMTYTAIGTAILAVIMFFLWMYELRNGPSQMLTCCCHKKLPKDKAFKVDEDTPLLTERA